MLLSVFNMMQRGDVSEAAMQLGLQPNPPVPPPHPPKSTGDQSSYWQHSNGAAMPRARPIDPYSTDSSILPSKRRP